ncbi:MAG: ABC transporter substrate-binding protein [Sphaerochaetaceae bacterium]
MECNHPVKTLLCMAFSVICILSPISARGQSEHTSLEIPLTAIAYTDSRGVSIALSGIPRKIISLSPNVTETLFALGLQERIVGRTDYCTYPAETASIASMGDLFSPSVEKILSMDPDLVIVSTLGQSQTIEAIESNGIPVAFIDEQDSMEGTYRIILDIARLTGTETQGNQIVASMKKRIEEIVAKVSTQPAPSVYYVAGFGEWGDFGATGDTYIHDLITLAGGRNVAEKANSWSFQLELLVESDPSIIVLPPSWDSTFEETRRQFVVSNGYKNLTAVKTGRIYPIDSTIVERQGPRSAQAVEALARIFHPDLMGTGENL